MIINRYLLICSGGCCQWHVVEIGCWEPVLQVFVIIDLLLRALLRKVSVAEVETHHFDVHLLPVDCLRAILIF